MDESTEIIKEAIKDAQMYFLENSTVKEATRVHVIANQLRELRKKYPRYREVIKAETDCLCELLKIDPKKILIDENNNKLNDSQLNLL